MTVCKACAAQVKTWRGDDPKCGFTTGTFTGENWMCATANAIRNLAKREGDSRISHHCDPGEQRYSTISTYAAEVLPYEDADERLIAQPVCLWVGWYKDRGRVEGMWLMFENTPPRAPTEEECLKLLAYFNPSTPET